MDKDMSQYGHYEEGVYSDHYATHVSAMTAENLHGKSEIAAELAYRDARIQQLEARNAELEQLINDHNEGCLAGCPHHIRKNTELGKGVRWRLKCDDYVHRGRVCPDCPKDWLIALTAGEVD